MAGRSAPPPPPPPAPVGVAPHGCTRPRPPSHGYTRPRPPSHGCTRPRPPSHGCTRPRPPSHGCTRPRGTAGCGAAPHAARPRSYAGAAPNQARIMQRTLRESCSAPCGAPWPMPSVAAPLGPCGGRQGMVNGGRSGAAQVGTRELLGAVAHLIAWHGVRYQVGTREFSKAHYAYQQAVYRWARERGGGGRLPVRLRRPRLLHVTRLTQGTHTCRLRGPSARAAPAP
jgi:hypothetical protein